jgi:uncharacterized protein
LILLPTEACNFRCVYCYEEFKYKRMEPWVVRGVKGLMSRRAPGLTSLSVSWFGGEPLLALDVIDEVMIHAQSLRSANPPLRVTSDATTNGYLLTPSVLSRLLELGVTNYQISFDGPREYHDRKRVLAGGKGTYDRIWENLVAARGAKGAYHIMVRLHVDHENAEAIPRFIEEYRAAFGQDPRFELFIRGLSRLGGPNDSNLRVFGKDEGPETIERFRALARSRGLRVMVPGEDDAVCYAARANSFVVRANGRLNKCTVALEHPNNQVGGLKEDGTVDLLPQKMMMWMRGLKSEDPGELGCPMNGYADPIPAVASDGGGLTLGSRAVVLQAGPPPGTIGCEKAIG